MSFLPPPSFFDSLLELDSSSKDERRDFIRKLPRLEEKDVAPDDTCAICQETLLAVIAAEEMASVMESPGLAEEDMGVVKLPGCGHHFCRKDIATWVYSSHSTCPACRQEFLPQSVSQQTEHGPTEPVTLDEAREFVRLLQLRTAGLHTDADAAHHNPFSEGGAPQAPRAETEGDLDLEEMRRIQDELMRAMFGDGASQRQQEEPRESFGMYS
ncbi:hypothetical protein RhiJN_18816 [Ceratobasidium sp. AG-Ba]|nr:hypothetical protein RhiJN_18816 [Ceratobasidium sp. AG-Ba]